MKILLLYLIQLFIQIFLIKFVWNSVLVSVFPTLELPNITLAQAWLLALFVTVLFKQDCCGTYIISKDMGLKETKKKV